MGGPVLQKDLANVVALLREKKFEKAALLTKRLLKKNSTVAELYYLLGHACLGQGMVQPAIRNFEKALTLRPSTAAYVSLAQALAQSGDIDAAVSLLIKMAASTPENSDQAFGELDRMGLALIESGSPSNAVKAYEGCVSLRPDSAHAIGNLGIALVEMGAIEQAEPNLRTASGAGTNGNITLSAFLAITRRFINQPCQNIIDQILETPSDNDINISTKIWAALQRGDYHLAFSLRPKYLNVLSYEDLQQLYQSSELQRQLADLPRSEGSLPRNVNRPLIYAGMDGLYLQTFGHTLTSSVLERCPSFDLHLHIMNPTDDAQRNFAERFPKDRVTISFEIMPPDKVAYSTRRFLRLSQIMRAVDRQIVLVDADVAINRDISEALPPDSSVVLYSRLDKPWVEQMVHAGFLAIAPSGRDFLDFVASYILYFEGRAEAKWYVDQMALISAYIWFSKNAPQLSIKNAPPRLIDWKMPPSPESHIWHFKGRRKSWMQDVLKGTS